ncbi:C-type lectin domain family 2 member H-like [Phodopus roborovskii]|uniref:C-type lectin domain family 2 member H-like n=1 Tax=Phodopus roborovskii TaxID=109678 RepID=UPI0021E4ABDD|nr:C-type lectin domain family 2 member H-like [Phodopus roborovskii]
MLQIQKYASTSNQILNKGEKLAKTCGEGTGGSKNPRGKFLKIISPVFPTKLSYYFCYGVLAVLSVAAIALPVALSVRSRKPAIENYEPCSATCPRAWIGFGSKCFYFSEDIRNWTFSQASCMALEAQLARFDNQEELNFLKTYNGTSIHWIGLHRKSPGHLWRWTDNTEYNNLNSIRGEGKYAYLSDRGISSGRAYVPRKYICSKPKCIS